jgi:hypothetical protein
MRTRPERSPVHLRRLAFAALAAGAASCASWQGRAHVLDSPLGERAQVRLWVRGEAHQVHAVRVWGDSVIAVPFMRPPACDTCALRFARADVDSVQVRATDWRRTLFAAIVLWCPVLYLLYAYGGIAPD